MKRAICWLEAAKDFVMHGVWIPHVYRLEAVRPGMVAATETGWRETTTYRHAPDERLYTDAYIVECSCVRCGKKDLGWCTRETYRRYKGDM